MPNSALSFRGELYGVRSIRYSTTYSGGSVFSSSASRFEEVYYVLRTLPAAGPRFPNLKSATLTTLFVYQPFSYNATSI